MQQQKSILKRQIIKKTMLSSKVKTFKRKRQKVRVCLWAALCLLEAACLQRRELTEVTWSSSISFTVGALRQLSTLIQKQYSV